MSIVWLIPQPKNSWNSEAVLAWSSCPDVHQRNHYDYCLKKQKNVDPNHSVSWSHACCPGGEKIVDFSANKFALPKANQVALWVAVVHQPKMKGLIVESLTLTSTFRSSRLIGLMVIVSRRPL